MPLTPVALAFRLGYVIDRSQITHASAVRRLNGIENIIALLVQRWRPFAPVDPAREIRMAASTRAALRGWVEEMVPYPRARSERFVPYCVDSVIDEGVPPGWVELNLAQRTR